MSDNAATAEVKGRALEDLICYVFGKIPGIALTERNRTNSSGTEEIDVAFWNDKSRAGLHFLPNIILVECKNWSAHLGSMEVAWFDEKLRGRGRSFGILIAAAGITGDPASRTGAHQIVARALAEQRELVIVTRAEIETIGNSQQVVRLIQGKLCELVVGGTIF